MTEDATPDAGSTPRSTDAVGVLSKEHEELRALFARISSPAEDRRGILKQLMQLLANHVSMEKQTLIPILKDRVEGGEEIADRLADEHHRTEKILTLLGRRKVNSPDVPDLVTELLDIHTEHTAVADNMILPALKGALDPVELSELGAAMISDERHLLTHSHPHLPDTGPIAAMTRKIAETVDRARDHSTDIGRTAT